MESKIKNLIISIGFVAIITIVLILNILVKDKSISNTERRKLAQFPEVTAEKIFNGQVMKKWEDYVTDQFVGRDFFRSIKSFCSINLFRQKDTNGLFEKDGAIYKMEYPLNENNVNKTTDKINEVYNKYLKGMNVFYAIIPDKNFYLENDDRLKIDYEKLKSIMNEKLTDFKYIDIWDSLTLEDYYKTDIHWKQENLRNVVSKIEESMQIYNTSGIDYRVENKGEFYGSYYGQLGMNLKPDTMYILTNETLDNCNTYNYETKEYGKIYSEKESVDKYDIFLYGATPLISIENPKVQTEKELLLFRDSFGSSIAPLLVENYKKIILIDIRYISNELLKDFIKFENQDVLFLYSTMLINQNILK